MSKKTKRRLLQEEIRYRWPFLAVSPLEHSVRTPADLALMLSEQMGFARQRALIEANGFWADIEQKIQIAVTE
jgi:hypothetical protein